MLKEMGFLFFGQSIWGISHLVFGLEQAVWYPLLSRSPGMGSAGWETKYSSATGLCCVYEEWLTVTGRAIQAKHGPLQGFPAV